MIKQFIKICLLFLLFILTPVVQAEEVVKIALVGDSTQAIWQLVQENLGDDLRLDIVIMTDPIQANRALLAGEVDLAAFQHYAALDQFNQDNGSDIKPLAETFISPMNILSQKIKSIEELKEGDKILIPESPTNRGRALKVLQDAGLIQLDPKAGYSPEQSDISENPLNLVIEEIDQAIIMNSLQDVAAGLTVANNVIDAGYDPIEDAIFQINIDPTNQDLKPYINLITTLPENQEDPRFKKIIEAYHQANVRDHLNTNYNHAMIPVF